MLWKALKKLWQLWKTLILVLPALWMGCAGGPTAPDTLPYLSVEASSQLAADSQSITVRGQIIDPATGQGQAGQVRIVQESTGEVVVVTTDAEGNFSTTFAVAGDPELESFTLHALNETGDPISEELFLAPPPPLWAAYLLNQGLYFETTQRPALYLTNLNHLTDGAQDVFAELALPAWELQVHQLKFSPDGTKLIFLANLGGSDQYELYLVDLENLSAGPQRLSADLSGAATSLDLSFELQWSPNSEKILYQEGSSNPILWLVDLTEPTGAIPISEPLTPGDVLTQAQFFGDSQKVVYQIDQSSGLLRELLWVDLNELAAGSRNFTGFFGRTITQFKVSPNGRHLLFLSNLERADRLELYWIDLENISRAYLKINDPILSPLGGGITDFAWSPDSEQVLYLANHGDALTPQELFLVSINNLDAGATRIHSPMTLEQNVYAFLWSPLGDQVLYVGDQERTGFYELFKVDLNEALPNEVRVNLSLTGRDRITDFQWSQDGQQIFYFGYQESIDGHVFFKIAQAQAGSMDPTLLSDALSPSFHENTFPFWVDPVGQRMIYLANQETSGRFDQYLMDAETLVAGSQRINLPLSTVLEMAVSDPRWRNSLQVLTPAP